LKTVIKIIFASAAVAIAIAPATARAERSTRERLAALADYVAADYPGAVRDGKVIAESEFDEQRGLISEPSPGHDSAREALAKQVQALADDVDARAPEAKVAADCRAIHKMLIDDYGLVLAPLAPPSLARAQMIYASTCAQCHGSDGRADTERAKTLNPPPLNFLDPERMARVSPALAFHALTFGIANTGMASFDTLPASDRWSLAFYVVGLRHQQANAAHGEQLLKTTRAPVAATASRLAELSDAQLDELLAPSLPPPARGDAIAYLRTRASFAQAAGGEFAEARRLLAAVAASAADRDKARELAVAAYLEGVEPHEAALRARDRALCDRVESSFLTLRHTIDAGATIDADNVRRDVARAAMILDGAEERQRGGESVPFFAALAIALREGFEISLLVAALLAFVRKSGHPESAPYVHAGWLIAVPAGTVTWFVVGAAVGGARRELSEGLLSLVAALMLLFVSHFVLGKLESRRWLQFLERKTRATSTRPWPLMMVAFVAAYREAIEIVLFFRALAIDSPGRGTSIAMGALVGVVLLAGVVFAMQQLGRRLNPRPVMLASGVLLTALAISLVGEGVRALQEGGYLSLTPVGDGNGGLPSIGLFPTVEGIVSQLVVLGLVLLPLWLERRRPDAPPTPPLAAEKLDRA
jgi:high-affinity iron transporter